MSKIININYKRKKHEDREELIKYRALGLTPEQMLRVLMILDYRKDMPLSEFLSNLTRYMRNTAENELDLMLDYEEPDYKKLYEDYCSSGFSAKEVCKISDMFEYKKMNSFSELEFILDMMSKNISIAANDDTIISKPALREIIKECEQCKDPFDELKKRFKFN